MRYIQGEDRKQSSVFPASLEESVTEDNPVRFIDAYVESLDLEALGFTRSRPRHTGRPGYNPRDILKLYVYGSLHGVTSSRKLERETQVNIEAQWLLRKLSPDHKTIADFRKDNGSGLERACREFIEFGKGLRAYGGRLVAIDGTKLKASACGASAESLAKLAAQLRSLQRDHAAYLRELDRNDRLEEYYNDELAYGQAERVSDDDGARPDDARPDDARLEALRDRANRRKEEVEENLRGNQRARGAAESARRELSDSGQSQRCGSDQDARIMKTGQSRQVCYNGQIAVDADNKLIVACDLVNAPTDIEQLAPMALAAKQALGVGSLEATADAGYFNISQIAVCAEESITVYAPAISTSATRNSGLYHKDDFIYEAHSDSYRCPSGARLRFRGEYYDKGKALRLREYRTAACGDCVLRDKCTTNKRGRRIRRRVDEAVYEAQRALTEANPGKVGIRKALVEHVFGTMKRYYNHGALLTRGLWSARAEFSLMVLSYNLRRLINIFGVERLLSAVRESGGKTAFSAWKRAALEALTASPRVYRTIFGLLTPRRTYMIA